MPAAVLKVDYKSDIFRVKFLPALGFSAMVAEVCKLVPDATVGLLTFSAENAGVRLLTECTYDEFLTAATVRSIYRLQLQVPGGTSAPQEEEKPKRPSGAVRRARARDNKAVAMACGGKWKEDKRDIDALLVALEGKPLPVGPVPAGKVSHQGSQPKKGIAIATSIQGFDMAKHEHTDVERVTSMGKGMVVMGATDQAVEEQRALAHHHGLQEFQEEGDQREERDEGVEHQKQPEFMEVEEQQAFQIMQHIAAGGHLGIPVKGWAKCVAGDAADKASDCATESTCEDAHYVDDDADDEIAEGVTVKDKSGNDDDDSDVPQHAMTLWPATPDCTPPSSPRLYHNQLHPVVFVPVPVWVPPIMCTGQELFDANYVVGVAS